ncbi:MAG: SNF2 helicase associated domain-containing protein [Selenomonas sp.]|nr:SNF2 helicase associated domain-containing protein [Selenomonas sp.]
MLKDITIRSLANDSAYERGVRYYQQGRVLDFTQKENGVYRARVEGKKAYKVEVRLSKKGDGVEDYSCNCPAAELYLGACKHTVAVLKEIQDAQRDAGQKRTTDGQRIFTLFGRARDSVPATREVTYLHLVPRLYLSEEFGRVAKWLEFRVGEDKLYVVRNLRLFLEEVEEGARIELGKNLAFSASSMRFADALSEQLWQMLVDARHEEMDMLAYSSPFASYRTQGTSYLFDQKKCKLTPRLFEKFLSILGDAPCELHFNDAESEDVRVRHERPKISVSMSDLGRKGALLTLRNEELAVLDEKARYLYLPGTIYAVDDAYAQAVRPLLEAFRYASRLTLARKDVEPFFRQVLPVVEEVADVQVDQHFLEQFELAPLHAQLYFDYHGDGIEARPVFSYEAASFNPLVDEGPAQAQGERILVRNDREERDILNYFAAYGFTPEGQVYVQPDEEKSYDFLTEALPALAEKAEIFYADAFQKKPVQRLPQITAGVSVSDDDLLEVTFHGSDMSIDELIGILQDYRQKRRYHRLKDGTFVTLGEQQLSALADFVENTGLAKKGARDGERALLPLSNAMYLDALARDDEDGLRLERSKNFRRIVRDIREPQDADTDVEVPETLAPVLRDYQVMGLSWLSSLAAYGLGGILADDMGLGKTLQVIAFLLAHRDEAALPSLVVAPTSLVYNWLDEIERFAPELRARVIAGTKKEREEALASTGEDCDVLITTYNMLKRDIKEYAGRTFRYAFLDEAQHIKNPATQNAKAVKKLRAGGRFALTGTPIENTLTELWSIFDFLMPGYLLTHQSFKARYEVPIVREENPRALKNLRRHVEPFILRRLKKDVLKELPDKVERRMMCEMTPQQEKLYRAWLLQGQKEFRALLKERGLDGNRMKILALLTRLRQIACDPALFLEDYAGGSGKLDLLEEIVGEAVEGGHRLLIFSQFTTMLAHVGERLTRVGVPYLYLDGSTPSLERLRLVKEFNGSGRAPVFLISLKAGGTGLNLTGADMVIHCDPWWNPAVEDQATDRAYRLGQQKNVQVVKLITKDTIEEKIYKLQQRKKSLIDQMIQPGETFLTKLTDEEIAALFEK